MTSQHLFFPAALALAAAIAPVAAAQPEPEKVKVEVYADVEAISPGATFHLAVQYDIIPDWHIYWVNPGDTGYATSLEIEAPEGFTVGPVQYPGPHRFEQPGELVSFGYEHQATLVVEIKAPATLQPGDPIRIGVQSDWLVCKEACVMGKAAESLMLKTAALVEEGESTDGKRFAAAMARMPRELKELKVGQPRWRGSKSSPRFVAGFPKDVEFDVFPLLVEDVKHHDPEIIQLDDGSSRLSVSFDVNESRVWPAGPRSLAVLRVKNGDEERYYDLVPTFE